MRILHFGSTAPSPEVMVCRILVFFGAAVNIPKLTTGREIASRRRLKNIQQNQSTCCHFSTFPYFSSFRFSDDLSTFQDFDFSGLFDFSTFRFSGHILTFRDFSTFRFSDDFSSTFGTSTFRDFLTFRLFVFLMTFRLFGTFRLFVFLVTFSTFRLFRFFFIILGLFLRTAARDHRHYSGW